MSTGSSHTDAPSRRLGPWPRIPHPLPLTASLPGSHTELPRPAGRWFSLFASLVSAPSWWRLWLQVASVRQRPTGEDPHLPGSRGLPLPLLRPSMGCRLFLQGCSFSPVLHHPVPPLSLNGVPGWKAGSPAVAGRRDTFPELTPWVAGPWFAGKLRPMAWPPSCSWEGRENEWPWPQGGGGAGTLAQTPPGCAQPVWQRP